MDRMEVDKTEKGKNRDRQKQKQKQKHKKLSENSRRII